METALAAQTTMSLFIFGVLALLLGGVRGQLATEGRCPQAFGDFGDPQSQNCSSFLRCVDGTPHVLDCPPSETFHLMLAACRPEAEVDCPRQLRLFSASPLDLAFSASRILDPLSVRLSDAMVRMKEALQEELYFLLSDDAVKADSAPSQRQPDGELPDGVEFMPFGGEGDQRGEEDREWGGPVMAEQVLGAPSVDPRVFPGNREGPLPVAVRGRQGRPASGLGGLLSGLGRSGLGLPGVLSVLGGRAGGLGGLPALGGLGGLGGLQGPNGARQTLMLALVNNIAKNNKVKARARAGKKGKGRGKGKANVRGQGQPKPTPLPLPDLDEVSSQTDAPGIAPVLGGAVPVAPAPLAPPAYVPPPAPVPQFPVLPRAAATGDAGVTRFSAGEDKPAKEKARFKPRRDPTSASGAIPAPDTLTITAPAPSKDGKL